MDQKLYRRHLAAKRKTHSFNASAAEEAKWFQPGYNYTGQQVTTPFGNYYRNEKYVTTTIASQPHGDFKSPYGYHRKRVLNQGNAFIGGHIKQTATNGTVYMRSCYGTAAIRDGEWMGGEGSAVSSVLTSVMAEAANAMAEKIIDGFPSWDALTDLAELKETLGFLREGTTRLKDITLGCLTRNPKMVLSAFKVRPTKKRVRHVNTVVDKHRFAVGNTSEAAVRSAADLWLAYRYGFMPLLYSAEDAINAVHTPKSPFEQTHQVTFKGKLNLKSQTITSGGGGSGGSYLKFDVTTKRTLEYSYRLRATVSYRDSLMNRLGLNAWTIPKTLWEIVPFSFVVDWFYDLGGWFSRLNLGNLVASMKVVGTLKDRCLETVYLGNFRPSSTLFKDVWIPSFSAGAVKTSECRDFRRQLVNITANPPKLQWGIDRWKRELDSISLAIGFVKNPTTRGIP